MSETTAPKKVSTTSTPIIKCPHCGQEYLLGEIYMPGDLIGKPKTVIRDALGKIIYNDYAEDSPSLVEHYTCDHCGKPFIAEAVVSVKTRKEEEELDFSTPYVSLLD